jgi:hypothetical protein
MGILIEQTSMGILIGGQTWVAFGREHPTSKQADAVSPARFGLLFLCVTGVEQSKGAARRNGSLLGLHQLRSPELPQDRRPAHRIDPHL